MKTRPFPFGPFPLVALLVGGLVIALASTAAADDRDLFSASAGNPYVMVLFDTSGSMNWAPGDDGWVPADGDDPGSKFYQAKSALFEVMRDSSLDNIDWGFSTYNQDSLRTYRKHWLYTPRTNPSWVTSGLVNYPVAGEPKYFGDNCMDDSDSNTTCDLDSNDTHASCGGPQNVDNVEDRGELWSYPVLDNWGADTFYEWVRDGNDRCQISWRKIAGNLGDNSIQMELGIRCRRNDSCSQMTGWTRETVWFDTMYPTDQDGIPLDGTDFLVWQIDSHSSKSGAPAGFWNPDDHIAYSTCNGWEPNTDTSSDDNSNLLLKYQTVNDPAGRGSAFRRGDMVPLDWMSDAVWGERNRETILRRLAPNWDPNDPASVPDFRIAPYFQDNPSSITNGRLQLKNAYLSTPPLIANGATPIGSSMMDFNNWYQTWEPVASGPDGDPDFGCRNTFLLILTDGDDTCGGSYPCTAATTLKNAGVKTYVVGFGLSGSAGNSLTCIADNGGTGVADGGPGPILPQNKQELVDALRNVLSEIQASSRTFASAAVPQAQTDAQDQLFLTSFSPLEGEGVWPGRIDAYRKPLPLVNVNGLLLADRNEVCANADDRGCLSWDAGQEMLVQTPSANEIYNTGLYKIGDGSNERRVFWSRVPVDDSRPLDREYFLPLAPGDPLEGELYGPLGFGLSPASPTYNDDGKAVIQRTLVRKEAEIVDPLTTNLVDIEYVLGDIFHSDPIVVAGPSETSYFLGARRGGPTQCSAASPNGGYRDYVEKHVYRRQLLVAGSDDGQIHAFDAGLPSSQTVDGELQVEFDAGTGKEVFSVIPRLALDRVRHYAQGGQHDYSVDGPISVADVCIDPLHDGTPTAADREWRTLLTGGLREGGSGYYAIDVTQPDTLDSDNVPQPSAGYVPSCLDGVGGCGPIPYPSILWELVDTMDEDNNGSPDMGDTWSKPNTGRIRVLEGADEAVKYVSIFGGGLDPDYLSNPFLETPDGNFLYMVDVETGLVIYKRELDSPAASEPAAVDKDQDGFLDTIYIGTVGGFMYKADIRDPRDLELVTIDDWSRDDPSSGSPPLQVDVLRVTSADWDPFPIVDTGGRPIYYPPSVIYVSDIALYAIAFGTGDREDLWRTQGTEQHYYMVLDNNFAAGGAGLPVTAADLENIAVEGGATTGSPLYDGGWVLVMRPNERLITKTFSISGLTTFSTFIPDAVLADGLCARAGVSHLFTVLSTNADGLLSDPNDPAGDAVRSTAVGGVVSNPYINLGAGAEEDGSGGEQAQCPAELSQKLREIQPAACRFSPVTMQVNTIRSDTGHICIGEVPICMIERNWREQ